MNVKKIRQFAKKELDINDSGHSYDHTERVVETSLKIARKMNQKDKMPKVDLAVVELAALLHDVGDHKFFQGTQDERFVMIENVLEKNGVNADKREKVLDIICNISYSKENKDNIQSMEFKIIQDADRLEAMGAIGIARAFTYGGHKGQPIYLPSPSITPIDRNQVVQPRSTIQHFYDKLLQLLDTLHTPYARKIGEKRHAYLQEFLDRFLTEWEGKDSEE